MAAGRRLAGHEAPVMAVEFSPDGVYLVSSDKNGVRLWDTSSWQPLLGHTDMAWAGFFDDGRPSALAAGTRPCGGGTPPPGGPSGNRCG